MQIFLLPLSGHMYLEPGISWADWCGWWETEEEKLDGKLASALSGQSASHKWKPDFWLISSEFQKSAFLNPSFFNAKSEFDQVVCQTRKQIYIDLASYIIGLTWYSAEPIFGCQFRKLFHTENGELNFSLYFSEIKSWLMTAYIFLLFLKNSKNSVFVIWITLYLMYLHMLET